MTEVHRQLAPSRVGQATVVEQSRAVAEVHAAIVVAQQCPRNVPDAVRAMRESCSQPALADRAFFRFPRGRETVSGPSIHLARELARTWGNVQYGIAELRRDDNYGQSEMIAFAWDVQTNARASSAFIAPHRRDTKDGPKPLTDMRDIYESNANLGARRVREMIFAILPAWFTEEAKKVCAETLSDGGGKPLAQRVLEAIDGFARIGIKEDQLAQKIGAVSAKWTVQDVATLGVIYTSIQRGEVTKDEEFPPARVTAEEIIGRREPEPTPTGAAPVSGTDSTAAPAPALPAPATRAAVEKLDALTEQLGLADTRDLWEWLCGEQWTASRTQVRQATGWLESHLEAAKGDTALAAKNAWDQYHDANPEAGDE
jgi:hypothetical protein